MPSSAMKSSSAASSSKADGKASTSSVGAAASLSRSGSGKGRDGGGENGKARSSSRKKDQLTADERRIYAALLNAPKKAVKMSKLGQLVPDIAVERSSEIINTLSRKRLVEFHTGDKATDLTVTAVSMSDASIQSQLEDDEALIYVHIKNARNDGIWTKNLKARANMHQAQMNKCLKTLENKKLIKSAKSVKYPTRKMYMLFDLQPSNALSGGPWFTDNEIDTEFIDILRRVLMKFIKLRSQPESRAEEDPSRIPLFPSSHDQSLPSPADCLRHLRSSNVTNTDLSEDDVKSLLDVLEYDGLVEKVFVVRMKKNDAKSAKRKHRRDGDEWKQGDNSDGFESASEDDVVDSDEDERRAAARRRKRKRSASQSNARSKQRRRQDSEDESDSDSEDEEEDEDEDEEYAGNDIVTGTYVYRTIRPMDVQTGWMDVPCSRCPVFDFCTPGGPVNAEGCVYMRDWLHTTLKQRSQNIKGEFNGHTAIDYAEEGHAANATLANDDNEEDEGEGEGEGEFDHTHTTIGDTMAEEEYEEEV